MSDSSDDDVNLAPKEVANAELSFLSEKSREKYLQQYELFNEWRLSKGFETHSETVLLSYFTELSETRQPSTLCGIFSMLKTVIKAKLDGHIETYPELVEFIKNASEGYKSKKSKVFTASEIETFLREAPDSKCLGLKVVLIIGINSACHCNELLNITVNDVEKHSGLILVKLYNTKTNMDRNFVIRPEEHVKIIETYMALRPSNVKTDRFFLQYLNGKCRRQPMGINKFGAVPRKIATFLKLKDPELYTGHCLKRTSAFLIPLPENRRIH